MGSGFGVSHTSYMSSCLYPPIVVATTDDGFLIQGDHNNSYNISLTVFHTMELHQSERNQEIFV